MPIVFGLGAVFCWFWAWVLATAPDETTSLRWAYKSAYWAVRPRWLVVLGALLAAAGIVAAT